MTERELNIALREMARAKGLCDDWYSKWGDDDTIEMCLLRAIRGFDFCVECDYPPLDFIRSNFDKEILHRYNIFLDEEVTIDDGLNGYYVFLGDCIADVNFDGFKAATVYVRHNSKVNVKSSGGSKVFVSYYDSSQGDCKSDGWSACKKYDRRKKEG